MAIGMGLLLSSLGPSPAAAASINYGTIGLIPPGVMFINVTESSGTDAVPLYNPPATLAWV